MKRRLFLQSGSAAAITTALAACGGGGGGASGPAGGSVAPGVLASASASALPEKILGCYYTAWDTGSYRITDIPAEFNVIYLFHCKPNGKSNNAGDGGVIFEYLNEITAQMVQTCRGRGQKVIL